MADHGERVAIDMDGMTYLGEIREKLSRENKAPIIMLEKYMVRPTKDCHINNRYIMSYYNDNPDFRNEKGSVTLDLETRTAIHTTR